MFSRIPMPQIAWREDNMRYVLASLPLVGAVIGLASMLWVWACSRFSLSGMVWSAGLMLIPLLISGGIHLDGLADTADALASHAEPERKRAILKDPHTGAFAVIAVCAYLITYFALGTQLVPTRRLALALLLAHTLSRAAGAMCSLMFPGSGSTGILASFRDSSITRNSIIALVLWQALSIAGFWMLFSWRGLFVVLVVAAAGFWLRRVSQRQFGGMSGDLTGAFIQIAEILMLVVLTILQGGGAL